jgi:hypothetical protein
MTVNSLSESGWRGYRSARCGLPGNIGGKAGVILGGVTYTQRLHAAAGYGSDIHQPGNSNWWAWAVPAPRPVPGDEPSSSPRGGRQRENFISTQACQGDQVGQFRFAPGDRASLIKNNRFNPAEIFQCAPPKGID